VDECLVHAALHRSTKKDSREHKLESLACTLRKHSEAKESYAGRFAIENTKTLSGAFPVNEAQPAPSQHGGVRNSG
jgi:hypothetical protein